MSIDMHCGKEVVSAMGKRQQSLEIWKSRQKLNQTKRIFTTNPEII